MKLFNKIFKDSIKGEYVKYSHVQATINPLPIYEEYRKVISIVKGKLKRIKGEYEQNFIEFSIPVCVDLIDRTEFLTGQKDVLIIQGVDASVRLEKDNENGVIRIDPVELKNAIDKHYNLKTLIDKGENELQQIKNEIEYFLIHYEKSMPDKYSEIRM